MEIMKLRNRTMDRYFVLIVLSDVPQLKILLFVIFLAIYLVTLLGNLLLILLQRTDPRLHSPMYFFLVNLSFIDIFFTTTTAPKMLAIYLTGDKSISFLGCAAQMWFSLSLGSTECLLLAVMAYDRHLAICQPLRYHVLMNRRFCILLAAFCWISAFVASLIHAVFTFLRPFCKSRDVNHFYCEIQPLFRLACTDTHTHEIWLFAGTVTFVVCAFLVIFFSYIHIITTVVKLKSSKGKSKAFSTCSSHLLVVVIYYGTIMSIYLRPISSYDPERDRVISLLYMVVTPMCNPVIYSIRNKEVKDAMKKIMGLTGCTLKCIRRIR